RAVPLLKQAADERDETTVKLALAGLRLHSQSLKEAEEAMSKAGPYQHPVTERARQTRRRLLAEETKLLTESVRCLEEKSDSADDRLVQQIQQVKRYHTDWERIRERLLRGPPDQVPENE